MMIFFSALRPRLSKFALLQLRSSDAFICILSLTMLNLPFWLLEQRFFLVRPLISWDILVALFVFTYSLRLGVLALVLAWALDFLVSASISYHFTALDFINSARFTPLLNLGYLISPVYFLIIIAFAVIAFFSARLFKTHQQTKRGWLILCVAFLLGLDVTNGSAKALGFGKDSFLVPMNIAGSPTWNMLAAEIGTLKQTESPITVIQSPTYEAVKAWHDTNSAASILLVVVESLGLPRSVKFQAWLEAQLINPVLEKRWSVSSGVERFYGSTTYGELRSLCGLSGHYSKLSPEVATVCLPAQLSRDGFTATGMHGFSSNMFDRSSWWPMLGLNASIFAETLGKSHELCGEAFPGICDHELIDMAVAQASRPKSMVYLLTLNTHLPLVNKPISESLKALCTEESIGLLGCQLLSQHGQLLNDLGNSLTRSKSAPFVMIVGDHAPPFTARADRMSFDQKYIPYYKLSPIKESKL